MCFATLSGCKSAKLAPSRLATQEVGKVGDQTVYYEELYYLASTYKSEGMSQEQLWELINQNIITNHAMVILSRDLGVQYDEEQLEDDIQAYIDSVVSELGSASAYKKALNENHLTDHYMRFVTKADLLYAKAPDALATNGSVISDKDEFAQYIKDNFVRTWHFMIANNKNDDITNNQKDIQAAYEALVSEKTTIYNLTSGKYKLPNGSQNEDVMMPQDGYAFTKGNMDTVYETTAFDLEVGEYSNVIMTTSELASGEVATCYYVIQRLDIDDEYINKNYNDLYDDYIDAIVVQKLDAIKAELSFIPNEYANSLNILELEPVGAGTNVRTIIIISSIALGVALATTVIVICIVRYRKSDKYAKKMAKLAKAKRRGR